MKIEVVTPSQTKINGITMCNAVIKTALDAYENLGLDGEIFLEYMDGLYGYDITVEEDMVELKTILEYVKL